MTDADDHPQTPPLSVPASDAKPSHLAHSQRPFSPLTLDELGLHPPSTPSALLDIITPASLALQEDCVPAATDAFKEKPKDGVIKDASSIHSQGRVHDADTSSTLTRAAAAASTGLLASATSAPTTHSHDSFLTSFLQSLTGDSILPDSNTPPSAVLPGRPSPADHVSPAIRGVKSARSSAQVSGPSLNPAASSKVNGPVTLSKLTASSYASQVGQKTSSHTSSNAAFRSFDDVATTDFHGLFQTTSTARGFTNHRWPTCQSSASSRPAPFLQADNYRTSSPHLDTSMSSTMPSTPRPERSWAFLGLKGSEESNITSTPLEQLQPASQAAVGRTEAAKPTSAAHESKPARGSAGSDPSKAKWSLDLSSLSHFSLPQAPPLQPKHRYPISILETDGHYETEFDTDRDSETSPSGSHSFLVTPKSATSGSFPFKSKSLDTTPCDRQSNPTSSCTSSSQGKPVTSEAHTSGNEAAFKLVPLSNVVRSRSFSSASQPPSDSNEAYAWPSRSLEPMRAEGLTRSYSIGALETTSRRCDAGKPWPGQFAASSTPKSATSNSTARATSYDFTRQALLDLIRRTNLGIANNAAPSDTPGSALSKNTGSSQVPVSAAQPASGSFSAPPFTASSAVPADLQARLQSWQHHRKRQRLLGEAANEVPREHAMNSSSTVQSSANGPSMPNSSASLNEQPAVEEPSRSSVRSSTEEQDSKSRRQEHYQRLLYQLNAQMQMKMRMDLQKQKQKESQDKAQRESSLKRKGDTSKQVEFRKPGPPSKAPQARRMSLDAPSSSNRSSDGFRTVGNGSSYARSSSVREGKVSGTRPGSAAPNTNLATVKTNEDAAGTNTLAAGGVFAPSSVLLARSAHSWQTAGDTVVWDAPQGSSAFSSSRWMSPQNTTASWQSVCAPQYDPLPSQVLSNWQTHQSGFGEPSLHGSATPTAWTTTAVQGSPIESNSTFAMELMLKHPNWRRDLDASTIIPTSAPSSSNSFYTPHFVDTSSFAISSAAANASRTVNTPRRGSTANTSPPSAAAASGKSSVKRPISPGAEVVFWAVKGEHSVKLVGTIDSMTDRTATIFAKPGKSDPNSTDIPCSSIDGMGNDDVQERYENVPFVNILAKDQASLLGFL